MGTRKVKMYILGSNGKLKEFTDIKITPVGIGRREDGIVPIPKKEAVNHPSHYNSGEIETIDAIEDWGFGQGFNLGNAIKYISRANHKSDCIEDLKKAQWYVEREISRLEKSKKITPVTATNMLELEQPGMVVLDNAEESLCCPGTSLTNVDDDIKLSDVIKLKNAVSVEYQLPVLTDNAISRINQWFKEHNDGKCACRNNGVIGGNITFEITPTSLGDVISVRCESCQENFLVGGI